MNETLEYRRLSAEWMGFENMRFVEDDEILDDFLFWHPDKDANQREMIEDWLIEQGHGIKFMVSRNEGWVISFYKSCDTPLRKTGKIAAHDKSKSIAFMKAFMEYYKNLEK